MESEVPQVGFSVLGLRDVISCHTHVLTRSCPEYHALVWSSVLEDRTRFLGLLLSVLEFPREYYQRGFGRRAGREPKRW